MDFTLGLLVLLQGHPNYDVREQATAALTSKSVSALPWLIAGSGNKDCEIANRCNLVLTKTNLRYKLVTYAAYQIKPTNYPRLPWIDSNGELAQYGVAHYLELAHNSSDYPKKNCVYGVYRAATFHWIRDALLGGISVQTIVAQLDRMAEFEIDLIEHDRAHNNMYQQAWLELQPVKPELLPAPTVKK